jgi:hypothetical protein
MTRARAWIERALPRVESEVVLRIQDWEPIVAACAAALAAAVRAKGEEDADLCDAGFVQHGCRCARLVDDHAADVPSPS